MMIDMLRFELVMCTQIGDKSRIWTNLFLRKESETMLMLERVVAVHDSFA